MKRIFTLLILSAMSLGAWAQQPATTTAEEPTLEQLSAEVATLKAQTSTWDKILSHLPKISGYIQLRYQWADGSSDLSTFDIKRARLDFKGNIFAKMDYRLQVDFAGSPKIADAYLDYKPFNEFKVKLGQFKIPFSIETDFSPNKLEFADYALPLRKLMAYSDVAGYKASGRDQGINFHGGFLRQDDGRDIIGYDVAVLNGQGINNSDQNKSKDIAARLMVRPAACLTLSGSYYRGEYGADDAKYLLRERYSAGVSFDSGRWVARGEWFGGKTGIAEGGTFDSDGWYAVLGFRATKTLMPALHCESFTENTDMDSRQTNYGVGLAWQPVKYLRCQLNYNWEDYNYKKDGNAVVVMITGMF